MSKSPNGIDATAAARSVSGFRRALGEQTLELTKEAVTLFGSDVVMRIDGAANNPRRVDTGETRDGWALATEQASGRSVGPTSAAPPGANVGAIAQTGMKVQVQLANLAPQAWYVEDGTPMMRPGYHLRDASRKLEAHAEEIADKYMVKAWEEAA